MDIQKILDSQRLFVWESKIYNGEIERAKEIAREHLGEGFELFSRDDVEPHIQIARLIGADFLEVWPNISEDQSAEITKDLLEMSKEFELLGEEEIKRKCVPVQNNLSRILGPKPRRKKSDKRKRKLQKEARKRQRGN